MSSPSHLSDLVHILTIRDLVWYQCSQSGPQHFGIPFSDQFTVSGPLPSLVPSAYAILKDAAPAVITPPAPTPVTSSSGPQRTRQSTREGRRFDPVRSTKPSPKKVSWEQTLIRFRAKVDAELETLRNVHDGQPSGGIVPEMALANVNKIMKEDLKRTVSGFFYCVFVHHFTNLSTLPQPLRDSRAGEGTRSRNGEKYLEGLLQVLLPIEPASASGSGSYENDTTIGILSRRKCFIFRLVDVTRRTDRMLQSRTSSRVDSRL